MLFEAKSYAQNTKAWRAKNNVAYSLMLTDLNWTVAPYGSLLTLWSNISRYGYNNQ